MKLSQLGEKLVEKIATIQPDEAYLKTVDYNPHDIFLPIVNDCLTIDNEKKFRTCIVKTLDRSLSTFEKALSRCYDLYRKTKNFDELVSCVMAELERSGNTKMINLVRYCSASLKVRTPRELYECIYSGLEAINEATKRALKELKRR